jgi:beta-fructofuranosidase
MTIFRRPSAAAAAGDPIPFFANGETHLFYLSSPQGTVDYPKRVCTTWQHAVTRDFKEWEELKPAVQPGAEGSYDGGGIWTGSVVEKDGTYFLFYTGHHVGAVHPQTICLATSADLINFERHGSGPLIVPTTGYEPVDWRDPYVFHNKLENRWWMLIAARLAHGPKWRRGCIVLATSKDLLNWEVEAEPLHVPGTTFCPECPELWEMNGSWYLVFSRFSEGVGTIYRVAKSPRGPFRVPAREELGGRRWYAAKSAPQADGSRAFFGWVHYFVDEEERPRWLWGGDFTAPRLVEEERSGELKVRLHPAVEHGFAAVKFEELKLKGVGGEAHGKLAGELPDKTLMEARFEPSQNPSSFGLALVTGDDLEGWFITLDLSRRLATLALEPRPLDDFWADLTARQRAYREIDGPVVAWAQIENDLGEHELKVLLDGEVLEIYVNATVALTHRINRDNPLRPTAFVVDGDVKVQFRKNDPLGPDRR